MTRQKLWGGVRLLGDGPCLDNVSRIDHNALPMIIHMSRVGLRVDLDHFSKLEVELNRDLDRITEEVYSITGHRINVSSGDQVSDLLFKKLKLKQARPKMTKSGDRESVEEQVLVAIQHEHPVVTKILDYKELDKLRGTYVVPMPKLARKLGPGHYRMFPNFTTTRVPSGRMACKEPNLLAIPSRTERGREVRKGFIAEDGYVILSVDECLHPQTLIKTPTGDVPISKLKTKDAVLTHRGDYIKWGRVTKSTSIPPKRAYRVTLDNGESVVASYDHRWPTQTKRRKVGQAQIIIKETQDLVVGERMVPCQEGRASSGYKTWYSHKGATKYSTVHRIVAETVYGPLPEGHHTHHKDEDKLNNDPSNLEYVDRIKHLSEHAITHYKEQNHTLRVSNLREALKYRRPYYGDSNPNAKITESDRDSIRKEFSQGATATELLAKYGLSYGYTRRLCLNDNPNHKVIKIEDVGTQPMWAITVEPDHNYVLSCGIVTQNSQIEVRMAAHCSRDPKLMGVYTSEYEDDVYSTFAVEAFHLNSDRYPDSEAMKWKYPSVHKMDHRYPAKTCILASIYDVSPGGLLEQMPVICGTCKKPAKDHDCSKFYALWNEAKCQQLIQSFYMTFPGIMVYRLQTHARARKYAYTWDVWGRLLHVAAVRSVHPWVAAAALREAGNFDYQSAAQGTIKLTMAAVWDDLTISHMVDEDRPLDCPVRPLLQVHDELLYEVREDLAEEIGELNKYRFETCVELNVPIKAGVEKAESWGHLNK